MNKHMKHINATDLQRDLLTWYAQVKRDLPFRSTRDPYYILISEIMSQQTQIMAVVPYYNRFIKQFPTTKDLAEAREEKLLKAWEGLGYYSRARNLQASAQMIEDLGYFPTTYDEILKLKGVGPYTAGAVASIAFNEPTPAVDGNVFRVISRLGAIFDDIAKAKTRKLFEEVVSALICHDSPGDFNQSLIELGALVCTPKSPKCLECPVQKHCQAYKQGIDDQLPVKRSAVHQKRIKLVVGVIKNEKGQWLIRKRPPTGLLANFYEFKQIEYEAGEPDEVLMGHLVKEGYSIQETRPLGFSTHIFSHRIWEMEAYLMVVDANGVKLNKDECWVKPEKIDDYSLAIAHSKIIKNTLS